VLEGETAVYCLVLYVTGKGGGMSSSFKKQRVHSADEGVRAKKRGEEIPKTQQT